MLSYSEKKMGPELEFKRLKTLIFERLKFKLFRVTCTTGTFLGQKKRSYMIHVARPVWENHSFSVYRVSLT